MASLRNQASAIAELAKVNPNYAKALSGENPPTQAAPPKPRRPHSVAANFFMYVLPSLCLLYWFAALIIDLGLRNPNFKMLAAANGVILLLLALVPYGIGRIIRSNLTPPPPPPAPILYTLTPIRIEFLKQYLGNEVIITLRYDIPVGDSSLHNAAGPLNTLLSLDAEEIIDQCIEESESSFLTADPKLQERLQGHTKLDTDLIEYQLVPRFGRAVYESKIPVFRFKVSAKSRRAVLEHDIEVGDIIDGTL